MKKLLESLIDRAASYRFIAWGLPDHYKRKKDAQEVGQLILKLPPEQRELLKDLKAKDLQQVHKIADLDPSIWYRKTPISQREKRSPIITYKTKDQ
jgi:hypothetical protein